MILSMIGGGGWGLAVPLMFIFLIALFVPPVVAFDGMLLYFAGHKEQGAKRMKVFLSIFLLEIVIVSYLLLKFAKKI
jgi:hypothetical protein